MTSGLCFRFQALMFNVIRFDTEPGFDFLYINSSQSAAAKLDG